MAHSARSKPKRLAKSIKVHAKGSDYARTVEERRERLAKKMEENIAKQKAADDKMDVEDKDKKIGTSGWRNSRRSKHKRRKASKRRRKNLGF